MWRHPRRHLTRQPYGARRTVPFEEGPVPQLEVVPARASCAHHDERRQRQDRQELEEAGGREDARREHDPTTSGYPEATARRPSSALASPTRRQLPVRAGPTGRS